ncbi:hypothetical protein PV10_00997 [Exophiala mesophila]|uniref:Cell wall biogenesis protein Mhp1 n=1 Tax=Exophiala mesophila TaxID=212818 RepID=A0A0D1ZRI4_EXOME|nr:uncharacterized protein PV10_00997 [Exophiala mesophila]KIV97222.1 hypothetical protein PV10_00997 [Exophiala mesophila]
MAAAAEGGLDVDWLLHSKKDHINHLGEKTDKLAEGQNRSQQPSPVPSIHLPESSSPGPPRDTASPKPAPREIESLPPDAKHEKHVQTPREKGDALQAAAARAVGSSSSHGSRPSLTRGQSSEDTKKNLRPAPANKKDGRRSSWISSFSSKFGSSSTTAPTNNRNGFTEATSHANGTSPQSSPKIELTNPFNKTQPLQEAQKPETKPSPVVIGPRRPSVLVAAGKETKLEHPGFLSSALRRLSSSTNTTMGKSAGSGALCPRKIMNIDLNRERAKLSDFDQNKLRRVAFCVDVEIAGFASQADEDPEHHIRPPVSAAQKQSISTPDTQVTGKKDSKDARMKDKGEGAALKNPATVSQEKETLGQTKTDSAIEANENAETTPPTTEEAPKSDELAPPPTTRKREKKKRSEAERKERKERKRKHAEDNGLVPLELTREDDDSDSSLGNTPPGSSTPRRGDGPTTDPLRIYKRCCQLRETTILSRMKEQISKPSAHLAEAPGTVAVMDLSNHAMVLQDIVTIADWLAVVPVRKLILDNCGLTDEGVRVILSGLSSCKSAEQARMNRKLPKRLSGKHGVEQMGVIERLSLKDNPGITNLGWKHIALFLHMTRSLRAIDLSGIPFPKAGELSRTTSTTSNTSENQNDSKTADLGTLIIQALSERLGDKLEELILSDCNLSTSNIRGFIDCAIKCKIRRLGFAQNKLKEEAVRHIARYVKSGVCEGLDLGGNNLHGIGHIIAEASEDENNPLFAISLANCHLDDSDLTAILTPITKLQNFKFIDLSQNHQLFEAKSKGVAILRKLLPRFASLRRIHLCDVGMTPDQAIALAEILPDCPEMAHVSILENEPLIHAMNSKEGSAQEEACAVFASLMTAVRVSDTIVAIEIEVPSAESSEVIKALASQVVAYSLRNMERTTLSEVGVKVAQGSDKDAPEILLRIVGNLEGPPGNNDGSDPAPDEDYVIASTGIVKALGICLGSKEVGSRPDSRNITPSQSGTATPRQGLAKRRSISKPRDVSLELCESARKIRTRLRPVLIKEDQAGNHSNYRRLLMLDQTLQRMIQRFEDEYPETKIPELPQPTSNGLPSPDPSNGELTSTSFDEPRGSPGTDPAKGYFPQQDGAEPHPFKLLARTPSNTSLVAKAYTEEEGRMHRFGQGMRREILNPTGLDDESSNGEGNGSHADALASLRARLEGLRGEEIRLRVEHDGVDNVIREFGINAKELLVLKEQDPEGFEAFRNSQLAAQINAGLVTPNGDPVQRD